MSNNFDELKFALQSEMDDEKVKAARILAQTGDASVIPDLEKQLASPNPNVRYFMKKAIDAIRLRAAGGGHAPMSPTPQQPAAGAPAEPIRRPDPQPIRPSVSPMPAAPAGSQAPPPQQQPPQPPPPKPASQPAPPADSFAPPSGPPPKMDFSDSELLTKLSKMSDEQKIAELARVFDEGDYDLLDNVVITKISELVNYEKNPEVACWYLKLVGKNGGQSFLSAIAKYLKSSNPKYISAALEALYYIKDKNLANVITQFMRHPDREVQSSAIAALWANDYEKTKQILEKMLNADEREYRFIAARSISKIPDDKSMELAMSIFYNEEDPEIFKIGVTSIQKKTNESNYYKLKEIIDSLPAQKANFIRQLIDKFDRAHQLPAEDLSDFGTDITIDVEAEKERERAEKEKMQKMTSAPKAGKKGQPQAEVINESDLVIDENDLKPVPALLIDIGSKKEVERIRAVKMLIAYLKKGAVGDTKEQILFAIELAQGDRSQRVRDLVAEAMKSAK